MILSVNGYRTTKNTSIIKVKPSGDLTGVDVDPDGYLYFAGNNVTRVTAECLGRLLDSTVSEGDSIIISESDSELEIEFGDFDIPAGNYRTTKISIYVNDLPEPIVIAGPGLSTEIELNYHN